MNKLKKKVEEIFPMGWKNIYQELGYPTSYKVTTHLNDDLEKATFPKMEAWEVKVWARVLEVSHSDMIFEYGCGLDRITGTEMNQLIQNEGRQIGAFDIAA